MLRFEQTRGVVIGKLSASAFNPATEPVAHCTGKRAKDGQDDDAGAREGL